jgi:tripartite-type tricarboxylate transporter receptor subunit TctC
MRLSSGWRTALWAAALWLFTSVALGQTYPSRPVRMVNPFPAGGPLDLMGRLLSERLASALGQPVLVENKPGAAGNIGAAEVAKAPADGHTVLLTLFSIVTSNPHLYRLTFDPLKDFAPVTALARSDSVVVVHPSVPAGSVKELVDYAKANPGKLNYSSAGKASPGHLTAEYFAVLNGVKMTHVPYKGNAEAMRGVISGETHVFFTPTTGALPQIKAGKLKALAVYLTERIEELPGVPSLPGFDQKTLPFWYGLLAPAGTPREAIARLHAETVKALKEPEMAKRLQAARIFVVGSSPEEFGAMMREGHAAWGRVIKETGITGE